MSHIHRFETLTEAIRLKIKANGVVINPKIPDSKENVLSKMRIAFTQRHQSGAGTDQFYRDMAELGYTHTLIYLDLTATSQDWNNGAFDEAFITSNTIYRDLTNAFAKAAEYGLIYPWISIR